MRLPKPRVHTTCILERRTVAKNTLEVSFGRPPSFEYRAGQYVQIRVPTLRYRDPKGSSRVFSLASSPLDERHIAVAFRETGSGYKRTLGELPVGSEVMVEGPHGFYTLPRNSSRPLALIAGGIGITPYRSMLRLIAQSNTECPDLTLLYANRTKDGAAYLQEIEELAHNNPRLTLHKRFGDIDEAFIRDSVGNLGVPMWYVAGPPAMVDAVRLALGALRVDVSDVHSEEFVGY